MTKRVRSTVVPLLAAATALCALASPSFVRAQRGRDHLTPKEVEIVRDAQELDARTGVFVKAAERRMQLITGQAEVDAKQAKKDRDKDLPPDADWGDLPKSTRAELLYDVAHILDEAIENIDNTAQHNPKSPLLHKSVRKLSDAAARFLAQLVPLRASVSDKGEREQLELAIDNAQQIVDAAHKLPAEEKDAKGGKKGQP